MRLLYDYNGKLRLLQEMATPYKCEVEYLDAQRNTVNSLNSQDAAYIDTGIIPDDTTIMEARIQFNILNTNNREQLNGSTGVDARFAFGFGSVQPYTNFYAGLTTQNLVTSVPRDLNPHTFILDALNKTITIDGTTESFTTAGSMGETEQSIYLFARNSASYEYANRPMNGKVYYCKITKNGSLVRDMIPVLDWNDVPCMYDKVSKSLFYSIGTGVFVAGRQIHPVEYIKGTGTQYFDSGVATSTATITECDCQYDPEAEYIVSTVFGSGTVAETSSDRFQATFGSNGNRITARICSATQIVPANAFERHVIRLDPINKRFYVDNDYKAINYSGTLNNTTITYFVRKMNSSADMAECTKMIFYAGKIWDGETLVRDFIPAIDENGVAFVFDRITHTIFDNAGTGYFITGNTLPVKKTQTRFIEDGGL